MTKCLDRFRKSILSLSPPAGALLLALVMATAPGPAKSQISKEDLIGLGLLLLLEGQGGANAPNGNNANRPAGGDAPARSAAPRSDMVADVQRRLNALGYDAGSVDGQMGPRTRTAIAAYQRDAGLAQTGEASPALIDQLDRTAAAGAGAAAPGGDPPQDIPALPAAAPPTDATADTLIRMALLSDQSYYRSVADAAGINYIRATGTDAECRALYEAQRQDEFARRDAVAQATVRFLQVMNDLPEPTVRAAVPIEATYLLGDYDFGRKGYPIRIESGGPAILQAGTVKILDGKRTVFCAPTWGYNDSFANPQSLYDTRFEDLTAAHGGVPGVDFLPLDEDTARLFANRSKAILIKGRLVVEPRAQGRGPLPGKIVSVAAYMPDDGPLLHEWTLDAAPSDGAQGPVRPLSPGLMGAIIAPILEPQMDDDDIDTVSVQYFRRFAGQIDMGNDPPGSPLPIDSLRGKLPEVIAELNRPSLRAHLREVTQPLPVTVEITEEAAIHYEEGVGLRFNALETGMPVMRDTALPEEMPLSDRGLQLASQIIRIPGWDEFSNNGYRAAAVATQHKRIALEFDRLVTLYPVPASIEDAAARGLVGNMGNRDRVALHWTVDLHEVRATRDEIILSARLRNLTYRWTSDGAVLASFDAGDFPTMEEYRQGIEAALPPLADAGRVTPPPDGSRWDAEMSDLLQLRHAGAPVGDSFFDRMMLARFFHEAGAQNMPPAWGHFFRDVEEWPTPEERAARLPDFRAWTEARTAAIPARLSLLLPLIDYTGGKFAPFENLGYHPRENGCRSYRDIDPAKATEGEIIQSRACAYLAHAWQTPEPALRLKLRTDCLADGYCRGLSEARAILGLADNDREDVILLDRLPVLSPEDRASKRPLAIELVVEPTGATIETAPRVGIYEAALRRSDAFLAQYNGPGRPQDDATGAPAAPFTLFTASAQSARLVDMETGEVLGELPLAEPAAPADDLLSLPDPSAVERDILGIRLGMSFDEADSLIRTHMEVSKLLTADRSRQVSAIAGAIEPFTSGRLYVSADGHELIAIHDEPPAAGNTVLGIWRLLRLPKGSVDPTALKSTLTERYGEPSKTQEVSLPLMQTGIAWHWTEVEHPRCSPIGKSFQTDLWRDADGATAWLPPFMDRPLYPSIDLGGFMTVTGDENPPSDFCPAFLGAQYSSPPASGGAPEGDEVLTWLTDTRAYAAWFYASKKAIAEGAALPSTEQGAGGGVEIKF